MNNYNYNYFIINNLTKDKIYHLTINNDLRFINFIGKNFYKTLLKFIDYGYIIKIYDWDFFFLKNEVSISNKLKIISNFNNYLCYFEYEDDFLYYFDNIKNKLLLANHSIRQLNIISNNNNNQYSSVHNLVNKCSTPMGRRNLKDKLLNVDLHKKN